MWLAWLWFACSNSDLGMYINHECRRIYQTIRRLPKDLHETSEYIALGRVDKLVGPSTGGKQCSMIIVVHVLLYNIPVLYICTVYSVQ